MTPGQEMEQLRAEVRRLIGELETAYRKANLASGSVPIHVHEDLGGRVYLPTAMFADRGEHIAKLTGRDRTIEWHILNGGLTAAEAVAFLDGTPLTMMDERQATAIVLRRWADWLLSGHRR